MPWTHSSSIGDAGRCRGSRSRAAGRSGRRGAAKTCAATSSSSPVVTPGRTRRASSRMRLGDHAARGAQGGQLIRVVDGHPVILTDLMSSATFTRPSRGDVLELTIDSLAHGGNGVARLEGYVVFVAGGVPGDRVRAEVGKAKKAYAEARAIEIVEPSPERVPGVRRPSRRAVAGPALRAPARGQGRAGRGRAAPDRQARRTSSSSRSSPPLEQWRYRNKLEYSFGTGPEGELVCGFHAPGRWNDIVPMDDCKLASERSNELREQVAGVLPRAGPRRLGPARPARLPAQPRDPRGPPHRPDAGAAGHLARQARHRRLRSPRSTPTACWWTQTADLGESTYGGETDAALRRPAADRAPQRPRLPDLARGVLPDQHRDGRDALRRRARVRRPARHRAGLRPLLRHRHDRALARHPRPPA